MNTRQAAIALGIIGLLATSISTQAAPAPEPVWQDNFNIYNVDWLDGQGGWKNSYSGNHAGVKDLGGGNKVVDLAVYGRGEAYYTLPDSFALFDNGDTHKLTFDMYLNRPGSVGSYSAIPSIILGQGVGYRSGYTNATDFTLVQNSYNNVPFSDYVPGDFGPINRWYGADYDSLLVNPLTSVPGDTPYLLPDNTWVTVTELITRSGNHLTYNLSIGGTALLSFTKDYTDGQKLNNLALYQESSSGSFYIDNMKAYGDQQVPASGTLIIIQ